MTFLNLKDKKILVTGVANKKSLAYYCAKILLENGADVIFTVQNREIAERVEKLFPQKKVYILNAESSDDIEKFKLQMEADKVVLHGFLHSMAYANYGEKIKPFHETRLEDYLTAVNISCFSLTSLSNALKNIFHKDASVVTVSISNTRATNYGYMGPIKAALETSVFFLAKSFSLDTNIRFNCVCAGPLKTSASAGIPGYIDNYLYAEQLTMRHEALETTEVANAIVFLLSPASSGINAERIVVDGGMNSNYFDEKVVSIYNNKLPYNNGAGI